MKSAQKTNCYLRGKKLTLLGYKYYISFDYGDVGENVWLFWWQVKFQYRIQWHRGV